MTWIRGGPTSLDIRNIKEAIDNRLVYFTTKSNTALFILILLGSGLEAQEFMIAGRWLDLASLMITSTDLVFSKASDKG
ncbi:hypothetical protein HanIR_Chr08g0350841 [Helianthus annuus]|nr:hypothetical protein HanIR_Chr08g0350841 [Helianthus annuus]